MRLKVKTPFSYVLWLVILFIIALLIVVPLISMLTGFLDIQDVYFIVVGAIVSWSAIIILALIGAIFVGMLLSHRILSVGSFTPFEEEMLKMRQDITAINEKLEVLMAQGGYFKERKGSGKQD